ncbi:MAG: hypothetical protein F4X56_09015 [Gammaproteobacteria bacterium]|nr:hypothetical protein [Gammaproteobacteria bacterium]MYC26041.1 hypothetical protein [Gammaproteobacteria bacterium]
MTEEAFQELGECLQEKGEELDLDGWDKDQDTSGTAWNMVRGMEVNAYGEAKPIIQKGTESGQLFFRGVNINICTDVIETNDRIGFVHLVMYTWAHEKVHEFQLYRG